MKYTATGSRAAAALTLLRVLGLLASIGSAQGQEASPETLHEKDFLGKERITDRTRHS